MDDELRIFEMAIDEWADNTLVDRILEEFVELCTFVHAGVREKTPVDTGYARNQWQVGINVMPTGTVAVSSDPVEQGIALLSQVQLGDTVFIINWTEYINALEDGHSRQAPICMVAVTLAEAMKEFARAA